MADILSSCVKILFRRSKHTMLTALSIAVGVCSVVMISSLGNSGIQLIDSEVAHLGLEGAIVTADRRFTDYRMDTQLCNAVVTLDCVDSAAGMSIETGKIRMHGLVSNSIVWGVGQNYADVMSVTLVHGRHISLQEIENGAMVCMLDTGSAKEFYKRENIVGKTLSFDLEGSHQEFEIVGIVETGGSGLQNMLGDYIPSFLYVPISALESMTGKLGYSQLTIKINDEANAVLAEESIINSIEKASGHYNIFTIENLSKQNVRLGNLLNTISFTLSVIAAISLIVAAIGTMTIMIISVKDRTKEIGIKKAVGATNKRILLEFLTESIVISCIGAGVGSSVALLVLKLCSFIFTGIPIVINGVGLSALICIVLGTLFGIIPATQAAKLDPIEALRNE